MVTLKKGQAISLKKEEPNLRNILVGLGWSPTERGINMDIDVSAICIDSKCRKESIVCFTNLVHSSGSIRHRGDNLTGEGEGDDEQITINLLQVPEKIERISIIINIFAAWLKFQDFSKVKNCYVHVTDLDTGRKLVHYDIDDDYKGARGIFVADLIREKDGWKFEAIGEGTTSKTINNMANIKINSLKNY